MPHHAPAVGRLRELRWIEGRNLRVDYSFSSGRPDRLQPLAEELVVGRCAGALAPQTTCPREVRLRAKCSNAGGRYFGKPRVLDIGNDFEHHDA
jgi:hypothetical protein